ncbi:tannase and feruloyl esterase [Colletotrichum tofieldiae]|nr:tannase and feruloyl esterase [Colletotrichum tofieldiae]
MAMEEYRDVFRKGVKEFDSVIGGSPDLRRFRERKGKVLMWHGMADQAISVSVGRAFYEKAKRLDEERGVAIGDYWRYFEVPGVNHCVSMHGAPFPWDAFERLRKWVEEGVAPDELEARVIVNRGRGWGSGRAKEDLSLARGGRVGWASVEVLEAGREDQSRGEKIKAGGEKIKVGGEKIKAGARRSKSGREGRALRLGRRARYIRGTRHHESTTRLASPGSLQTR